MADAKKDNKKVIIALIIVLTIVIGLLTGAIIGVSMKRNDSPEELVTDAFCEMSKNVNKDYCFHIPKINKKSDKIERINEKIYDTLYECYTQPGETEMYYTWEKKNDALSIVVEANDIETNASEYFVFNVDIKDEKELTSDELLVEAGVNEDEFFTEVRDAIGTYSEHEKKYFSEEDQNSYINDIIDTTLSDSSIGKAIPYIEGGRVNAVVYVFSGGFSEPVLQMLDLESATVREHMHCDGNHDEVFPENYVKPVGEQTTSEIPQELTTEPETESAEDTNDEWMDMLTKYYWDGSVQSSTVYRFFEDGTYQEYGYWYDFEKDFCPELLEPYPMDGNTYEIKDNKLYRYCEIGGEKYCTEFEWLSADSEKILDTWIKDICKDADYIFYDTRWRDGNFREYGDNSSYLKNTGWTVDENNDEIDVSESEEAKIYTEYLLNGGYETFRVYEYRADDYQDSQKNKLMIFSCLYDFDSDGTKELFLTIQDEYYRDEEGQALYTIRNGEVVTLLKEEKEFATMGYTRLELKYDTEKNIPVIEKVAVAKDSSAANFSVTTKNVYTAADGFSVPSTTYEATWLSHSDPYGDNAAKVEKVKSETDLYHIGETHFEYYQIDDEYVSKSDFEKYDTRFTEPASPELTLREGTWKTPIK